LYRPRSRNTLYAQDIIVRGPLHLQGTGEIAKLPVKPSQGVRQAHDIQHILPRFRLRTLFTTDLGEQGAKLMQMITVAVNGLDNLETLVHAGRNPSAV
jgi:hypothetical protein